MKASEVAFCLHTCREAAKAICAEPKVPFEHYQNLMKAWSMLSAAPDKVKEEIPVEKEAA